MDTMTLAVNILCCVYIHGVVTQSVTGTKRDAVHSAACDLQLVSYKCHLIGFVISAIAGPLMRKQLHDWLCWWYCILL
jgi:hypothetical protein